MVRGFLFGMMKQFLEEWWRVYNTVNVLNVTELEP